MIFISIFLLAVGMGIEIRFRPRVVVKDSSIFFEHKSDHANTKSKKIYPL